MRSASKGFCLMPDNAAGTGLISVQRMDSYEGCPYLRFKVCKILPSLVLMGGDEGEGVLRQAQDESW